MTIQSRTGLKKQIPAVPPCFAENPHAYQNTNIFLATDVCLHVANTRLKPFTAPSVVHLTICVLPVHSNSGSLKVHDLFLSPHQQFIVNI